MLLSLFYSCRGWNELGDDSLVYKYASLVKIPIVQWQPETAENKVKKSLFLQKCIEAENLEALYRKGVVRIYYLFIIYTHKSFTALVLADFVE